MKVWEIKEFGRDNLRLEEQPIPTPGHGEVVIRVQAFSLNYRDKVIVEGNYPVPMPLPLVPGSDAAGEIVSVGSGVKDFAAGDKVVTRMHVLWTEGKASYEATGATLGGPLRGVFGEYPLVHKDGVIKYPSYLTPEQASTPSVAPVTSWVGLFKHSHLQAGRMSWSRVAAEFRSSRCSLPKRSAFV